MIQLTISPGASLIVTAQFADESGAPVSPLEVTWELSDANGLIASGSETPTPTVRVFLGPEVNAARDDSLRRFAITARYMSSLLPTEQMITKEELEYYVG